MLDISRHRELFDSEKFDTPIHIIGAGATGSWVVLALAKLGIKDITVWDFDKIEEHNVPNQLFGIGDVGEFKVNSLSAIIKGQTDTDIKVKNTAVSDQRLAGIVFMMIDTMAGRKEIWDNSIKFKSHVTHLIEPRMGLDMCRVYNVNPTDINHVRAYESTLYDDTETEVSACGNSMTVISSSLGVTSWCVRQLIEIANGEEFDNEILIDFKNNNIITSRW